ncbi:MAG: AbrB/MazE/SpoVT family DNA-binding domain-containing protein [Euryarchaeota archaeon]|nr:AbrB/MazE/SpoVT family DNA-binding domain-containing protein [Euryarchaeota archaeon]
MDYSKCIKMERRTRKLIRIGNASLAVILPKPWLVYHKLKYGDLLEVITDKDVTIKLTKRRR